MSDEQVTTAAPVAPPPIFDVESISEGKPVSVADEQNTEAKPAPTAEEQKEETTEKKESRRERAIRRERDGRVAAETEAKILREQLAKATITKQEPVNEPPKREDFEDYEAYQDARQDWRADQKAAEKEKAESTANQGKQRQEQASQAQIKAAQTWQEREKPFEAATKDYAEVAHLFLGDKTAPGDAALLSEPARFALAESEVGPQLLYELAKLAEDKPDEYQRITKLSPARQIAELGKIEARLTPAAEVEKEPVTASKAPAPIKPVAQTRSASTGYSDKMSQADYNEWKKSQMGGKKSSFR